MSAPLLSMPRYKGSLFELTVSEYILLVTFLSMIGTILISLLCFCMGSIIKRAVTAYAAVAVIIAVPHIAVKTGVAAANFFDITLLYDTDRLYRLIPVSLPSPVYCICFIIGIFAIVLAAAIYLMRKIEGGYLT